MKTIQRNKLIFAFVIYGSLLMFSLVGCQKKPSAAPGKPFSIGMVTFAGVCSPVPC